MKNETDDKTMYFEQEKLNLMKKVLQKEADLIEEERDYLDQQKRQMEKDTSESQRILQSSYYSDHKDLSMMRSSLQNELNMSKRINEELQNEMNALKQDRIQ
jgi:hypothetical protein